MTNNTNIALDEISVGEIKERHREEHLCFKCGHHVVCGMAKTLDLNLLVTITRCLGFETIDTRDAKSSNSY